MSSPVIVVISVLAVILIIGSYLFALRNRETGYAAFGMMTSGLVLLLCVFIYLLF